MNPAEVTFLSEPEDRGWSWERFLPNAVATKAKAALDV